MDLFKQEAFKTGHTSHLQLLFKNLSDDIDTPPIRPRAREQEGGRRGGKDRRVERG
jgi:hypothetical protein